MNRYVIKYMLRHPIWCLRYIWRGMIECYWDRPWEEKSWE